MGACVGRNADELPDRKSGWNADELPDRTFNCQTNSARWLRRTSRLAKTNCTPGKSCTEDANSHYSNYYKFDQLKSHELVRK